LPPPPPQTTTTTTTFPSFIVGGWASAEVTERLTPIIDWTLKNLNIFTNVNGTHSRILVENYEKQISAGTNHRFNLDLVATQGNKFFVS
jgi:hypothetical protein